MANKIVGIVDLNNHNNQNIETLVCANILEKKCLKLTVADLNLNNKDSILLNNKKISEKAGMFSLKIFDRTNYIYPSLEVLMSNKLNDSINKLIDKNDIIIINPNHTKFDINTYFYNLATDIFVFANIKQNIENNLISFFLKHSIVKKQIHIFVYNCEDNIQDNKKYLSLVRLYSKHKNIKIESLDSIKQFKKIEEIENLDP